MKISTILDHIDSGHMALPEFQRGYVWNGDQVRRLFTSLYLRRPIGGLLVWATDSQGAEHRGGEALASGIVKLLLDGQQRITSIYGVVRGAPPKFFDGNKKSFTGLRFHLETESFEFYQPLKMKDDPLWIDVTALMQKGVAGLGEYLAVYTQHPDLSASVGTYAGRLSQLLSILSWDLHIEEVTGADKTLDVVVDIFNLVNSGGTKLSKGDLALAKICVEWPQARDTMKAKIHEWSKHGYSFSLDWLLRSVNTVLTGEAKFQHLHDKTAPEMQKALTKAIGHIDTTLELIAGRLGLDHNQVLFGRFGIPVIVRYLDMHAGPLTAAEQDRLLFWFVQAGMWGRFSGSTESYIDQDLAALEGPTGGLDALLEQLRLWHGGLRVEPGHFTGWSLGTRFYPVLYMLTRMGAARDWGNGLPLKAQMLGRNSSLDVHHIFPKAQLYKRNHRKPEVNALANYCFLTKGTNITISDSLPEVYFPKIEEAHPGALASQWVPMDPQLWRVENYLDFLEARKRLLADEMNHRMEELLHGDVKWMSGSPAPVQAPAAIIGGFSGDGEAAELEALNAWMSAHALPAGELAYEVTDPETGNQVAIFDMAWPLGVQEELSQPVVVLLNEPNELWALASRLGYRFFTGVDDFKSYVETEILIESGVL